MLSTLAGKVVTSLVDRGLGGSGAVDSGKNSFDAILERTQATTSTRAHTDGSNNSSLQRPVSTVVGGPVKDPALGLMAVQRATNGCVPADGASRNLSAAGEPPYGRGPDRPEGIGERLGHRPSRLGPTDPSLPPPHRCRIGGDRGA